MWTAIGSERIWFCGEGCLECFIGEPHTLLIPIWSRSAEICRKQQVPLFEINSLAMLGFPCALRTWSALDFRISVAGNLGGTSWRHRDFVASAFRSRRSPGLLAGGGWCGWGGGRHRSHLWRHGRHGQHEGRWSEPPWALFTTVDVSWCSAPGRRAPTSRCGVLLLMNSRWFQWHMTWRIWLFQVSRTEIKMTVSHRCSLATILYHSSF